MWKAPAASFISHYPRAFLWPPLPVAWVPQTALWAWPNDKAYESWILTLKSPCLTRWSSAMPNSSELAIEPRAETPKAMVFLPCQQVFQFQGSYYFSVLLNLLALWVSCLTGCWMFCLWHSRNRAGKLASAFAEFHFCAVEKLWLT